MLHLYTGDGKGKTTAAVGLALRAAASNKKVLFFQFLKNDSSGEIKAFSQINNIDVIPVEREIPFLFYADENERCDLKEFYKTKLDYIFSISDKYDVIIFDEAICAINENIIETEDILRFLPLGEIILTGRGDIGMIEKYADYITFMKKVRHPFDTGLNAREGIEF